MESMEEIYQNHSKKVYTFLLSKTCNHELAEELTQETFFCAVNSINKFKGNSSVLTWLCGIAQNLWLKYLRDNKSFEDLSNYEDIHEYPHNELLLLNITIILDSILLQTADDTLPIDSLDTKISDWYLHLAESNDEKIRNSANYMRGVCYLP